MLIYETNVRRKNKTSILTRGRENHVSIFLHFCLLYPDWQSDGIIYKIDAHLWGESAQKEIGAISQLGAEKITFPPKSDIRTDGHTDISNYRVASLLKINTHTCDCGQSWIKYILRLFNTPVL